jgi:hypothetical protein
MMPAELSYAVKTACSRAHTPKFDFILGHYRRLRAKRRRQKLTGAFDKCGLILSDFFCSFAVNYIPRPSRITQPFAE